MTLLTPIVSCPATRRTRPSSHNRRGRTRGSVPHVRRESAYRPQEVPECWKAPPR